MIDEKKNESTKTGNRNYIVRFTTKSTFHHKKRQDMHKTFFYLQSCYEVPEILGGDPHTIDNHQVYLYDTALCQKI